MKNVNKSPRIWFHLLPLHTLGFLALGAGLLLFTPNTSFADTCKNDCQTCQGTIGTDCTTASNGLEGGCVPKGAISISLEAVSKELLPSSEQDAAEEDCPFWGKVVIDNSIFCQNEGSYLIPWGTPGDTGVTFDILQVVEGEEYSASGPNDFGYRTGSQPYEFTREHYGKPYESFSINKGSGDEQVVGGNIYPPIVAVGNDQAVEYHSWDYVDEGGIKRSGGRNVKTCKNYPTEDDDGNKIKYWAEVWLWTTDKESGNKVWVGANRTEVYPPANENCACPSSSSSSSTPDSSTSGSSSGSSSSSSPSSSPSSMSSTPPSSTSATPGACGDICGYLCDLARWEAQQNNQPEPDCAYDGDMTSPPPLEEEPQNPGDCLCTRGGWDAAVTECGFTVEDLQNLWLDKCCDIPDEQSAFGRSPCFEQSTSGEGDACEVVTSDDDPVISCDHCLCAQEISTRDCSDGDYCSDTKEFFDDPQYRPSTCQPGVYDECLCRQVEDPENPQPWEDICGAASDYCNYCPQNYPPPEPGEPFPQSLCSYCHDGPEADCSQPGACEGIKDCKEENWLCADWAQGCSPPSECDCFIELGGTACDTNDPCRCWRENDGVPECEVWCDWEECGNNVCEKDFCKGTEDYCTQLCGDCDDCPQNCSMEMAFASSLDPISGESSDFGALYSLSAVGPVLDVFQPGTEDGSHGELITGSGDVTLSLSGNSLQATGSNQGEAPTPTRVRIQSLPQGVDTPVLYYYAGRLNWTPVPVQNYSKSQNQLTATLSRFGFYQMFAAILNLPYEFGEVYVFPNPSKEGAVPTLHAEVGQSANVSVRVYDIAGDLVYESRIDNNPVVVDGKPAYEHALPSDVFRSGQYNGVVTAEGRVQISQAGRRSTDDKISKNFSFTVIK